MAELVLLLLVAVLGAATAEVEEMLAESARGSWHTATRARMNVMRRAEKEKGGPIRSMAGGEGEMRAHGTGWELGVAVWLRTWGSEWGAWARILARLVYSPQRRPSLPFSHPRQAKVNALSARSDSTRGATPSSLGNFTFSCWLLSLPTRLILLRSTLMLMPFRRGGKPRRYVSRPVVQRPRHEPDTSRVSPA